MLKYISNQVLPTFVEFSDLDSNETKDFPFFLDLKFDCIMRVCARLNGCNRVEGRQALCNANIKLKLSKNYLHIEITQIYDD